MNRKIILIVLALLLFLALTQGANIAPVSAQSGGGYDLTWSTIDGGGGLFSTGGTYSLSGTIGQADAGTMSGGNFSLAGGFWRAFEGSPATAVTLSSFGERAGEENWRWRGIGAFALGVLALSIAGVAWSRRRAK